MADGSQYLMSRRQLMVGALAAPVVSPALTAGGLGARQAVPDPIVAKAGMWIAGKAEIEAMIIEWQDLENVLFGKARAMKIKFHKATGSRMTEARAMRAISRKMDAAYLALEDLAAEISAMTPVSAAGALAKIDLGLRVQDPYAWNEHAFELAEDGVKHLGRMVMG
jgi:hypothetical protein